MTPLTARPLHPALWLGVPALVCALASLLFAMPFSVYGLRLPEPVFAFVPAFAWAVIRPSVLPPFALMLLGLFLDLIWGGTLGLWPVCLLAAYAPVLLSRRLLSGLDFWGLWAWYLATCVIAFGLGWSIVGARSGVAPDLVGTFWQFLVTGALFPFAFGLIERYEDADVRFR